MSRLPLRRTLAGAGAISALFFAPSALKAQADPWGDVRALEIAPAVLAPARPAPPAIASRKTVPVPKPKPRPADLPRQADLSADSADTDAAIAATGAPATPPGVAPQPLPAPVPPLSLPTPSVALNGLIATPATSGQGEPFLRPAPSAGLWDLLDGSLDLVVSPALAGEADAPKGDTPKEDTPKSDAENTAPAEPAAPPLPFTARCANSSGCRTAWRAARRTRSRRRTR